MLARLNGFNLILFFIAAIFLAGFQTTFWFQLFGGITPPMLWLNLVLYLILYRKPVEGILMTYAVVLIFSGFSAAPVGVLWLNLLVVFAIVSFVKVRIFWPGSRYFFLASLGISLCYEITMISLSHYTDMHPTTLQFGRRLIEVIFTPLTSIPIYVLLAWIDDWTGRDFLPESGGPES